ncbi:MAG: flagellin [Candidatus Sericytochromatia bacterium]|nr:flagellin [Candidatus Sericytochromatia bacterium]
MLSTIHNSMLASRVSDFTKKTNQAMDRISSGSKLNTSWENPAAFSVAETYRTEVNTARSVASSLQDAINIVRIGEDGIRSIVDVLQDMREVVVQAANGTNTQENLGFYQKQLDTMKGVLFQAYITAKNFRVSFEGDETADRVLNFMVGTNPGDTMAVDYNPLRDTMKALVMEAYGYKALYEDPQAKLFLGTLGVYPPPPPSMPVPPSMLQPGFPLGTTFDQMYPNKLLINPSTPENVSAAFATLDKAKGGLLQQETYLGTVSQRLELHLTIVQKFEASVATAESSLRDADLAVESTNLTKAQVLQSASQAMLVQANARLSQVLELIRQN